MGRIWVLVAAGVCASGAWGRQEAPPLAGPAVVEPSQGPTLVHRGYEGLLSRLDVPPEEEALKLVKLDADARAATERILVARAAILDSLVHENLDTLIELGSAGAAGDKARAARLGLELIYKAEPLRSRGPLRDELAGAMPEPSRSEYLALVAEYWQAVVDEERARGAHKGRLGIVLAERGRLLGEELKRSLERQVDKRGGEEFDRLLSRLELRPEQEARVRRMAEEFIIGVRFRPTKAQEAAFIVRVASMLDEGQRRRLGEYIAEHAAEERAMEGSPAMSGKR